MTSRTLRNILAAAMVLTLIAGLGVQARAVLARANRTHVIAYFDNSNGLYRGDEVRILGVPVGEIESISAEPERVKVAFWVASKYKVPADARAVIVSPQLVTSRAIQLTPAYTDGPTISDGTVIPQDRTAVPLEWDDLRQQLEKLTDALQPTEPGGSDDAGVSTLGSFVTTTADNLRGQGANIRDTIIKLSKALSTLGDHSGDLFGTVKNLSVVVSALEDSSELLHQLNGNLAAVTGLLTGTPGAVGDALKELSAVVGDATRFISDNREALGVTSEKVASISTAVHDSLDDVEQSLHMFPNTLQNFINIYQPTQQGITGALTLQNFANPISFLCGGIQAASRLNAEQSAKLCVQYLAPIIKNRQYNFFPLGANYFVGQSARPNELTYSEDWLRPDFAPTPAATPTDAAPTGSALPAEAPPPPASVGDDQTPGTGAVRTDPTTGLEGIMLAPGAGS